MPRWLNRTRDTTPELGEEPTDWSLVESEPDPTSDGLRWEQERHARDLYTEDELRAFKEDSADHQIAMHRGKKES